MSKLRVVLLGIVGHGKTSLFNKIAQTNEPTKFGGKSLTKQIVIGKAANGEFEIVDTPGFDASEDKLLHAAGVIAGLAQGDVNRILIVVQCQRIDLMIRNLKKIIEPIKRFREFITIIVSHWDDQQKDIKEYNKSIESQQKEELEIKQKIEFEIKKNFNICSVMYKQPNDDPKNITKKITDIILNSQFAKIQLLESEIYSQFDLLSLDDESETEFNKSIKRIKIKFRKIAKSFLNYIQSLKLDDSDLIDKLHYLSLGIKDIANEQIENFEKEYGDYMNEFYDTDGVNVRYLHHIYLKKELRLDIEEVIKKAQEKMKESQNHCFNWIKQCPFCGLVWIKVIGCDGQTTCGNRVHSQFDSIMKKSFKQNHYKIVVKNDSVDLEIDQKKKDDKKLLIKKDQDIFQILINSVKDDLIFGYENFSYKYFGDSDQINHSMDLNKRCLHRQFIHLVHIYVYEILVESFNDFQENINEVDIELMIKEFKVFISQNGLLKNQQNKLKVNEQKSFGCGKSIVWKDLPPLSGQLLKELLTPEMIDYFNDQNQLLKDEANDIAKELEKTYKDLVNQAINEQFKNVKVIQKQQNKIENQSKEQKNEQQHHSITQNYQKLIEDTKETQQGVQRRYSIKMMTDPNLQSEAQIIDPQKLDKNKTQSLQTK